MKFSIKFKISLIYIILIILMILLGILSLLNMYQIQQSVNNLITTNYNSINRISIMSEALQNQKQNIFSYLYESNKISSIKDFEKNEKIFINAYEDEHETIFLPNEVIIISNIESSYEDVCNNFDYILTYDVYDEKQLKAAKIYYYQTLEPQIEQTFKHLDELKKSNETALFARRDEASEVIQNAIYVLMVVFGFTALVSWFTFKYYTNFIIRPIIDITQNIKSIRQGNMNRKAFVESKDELGLLCVEFNNMTQRLTEFEQSTMGSLMQERNKTLAITMSITEPLVILDENSNVTLMNYSFEKLLNIKNEDVKGKHFFEIMSSSPFIDELLKLDFHTSTFKEKIITVFLNEKPKYYNVMITPFSYTEENDRKNIIVIFYDITELKSLEKARIDFIATISHEFKTPLTSIVMGVDLLENNAFGELNEEQKEIVETISDDGQRLCMLVNDLLELSKIESSSNVYRFEKCSIEDIIDKSLKQFYYPAKLKQKQIIVNIENNIPQIMADEGKIGLVINNLMSNAIKYTKEFDSITVSAKYKNDKVYVSVKDNGTGIPEEFLEKIFEKYVQVDNYDLEVRGTGIGLSAAREIINAHHGKIWCESKPDLGSVFTFVLPINQPEENKE